MKEVIPYKSLFYLKRSEEDLVRHIFIDVTNNVHISRVREFSSEDCLKEISEEELEYLMNLSELDLHIPYILHLINQE